MARAHQKNNSKTQKGKFMTYTVGQQQDAETSGENTYKKNADNIEVPAKDNNITGVYSYIVLTYRL